MLYFSCYHMIWAQGSVGKSRKRGRRRKIATKQDTKQQQRKQKKAKMIQNRRKVPENRHNVTRMRCNITTKRCKMAKNKCKTTKNRSKEALKTTNVLVFCVFQSWSLVSVKKWFRAFHMSLPTDYNIIKTNNNPST